MTAVTPVPPKWNQLSEQVMIAMPERRVLLTAADDVFALLNAMSLQNPIQLLW